MPEPVLDDLGAPVPLVRPASRVISLVPSLTEALAATCPEVLIGATEWCSHPADLVVPRVRGTKNPDVRAIVGLRPDVVLANMEENRALDVERLREAGVPVWVTRIETVPQAIHSIRRFLLQALYRESPEWLERVADEWAEPASPIGARVAIPVWRDPWMVVGSSTFTGDLVQRLGLVNAFSEDPERYPSVGLDRVRAGDIDLVLLPDEPYEFTEDDGPEAFPGIATALVSGRLLTWYGPSMLGARAALLESIARI